MNSNQFHKAFLYKNKHRILFLISLIALASCNKPVTQSYIPNKQDYMGMWKYEVYIDYTTEENKFFGLGLRNAGNDSIVGIFYSVWQNGDIRDGGDDYVAYNLLPWEKDVKHDGSDADEDYNVFGKFVNDSLYVTLKGSYCENTSAKAVVYLENDSSLLWKLISKEGEIYVPDSTILDRYEIKVISDSTQEQIDSSHVQLKGKLSEYSVYGAESEEYGDDVPMGYVSLLKNGETISKIDLPCYMPNCDFMLSDVTVTAKGFNFSLYYGHTHLRYGQIFVIEYINNDFYLVKTIDYEPNALVPYGEPRESENKLKEPIPFSKLNIEKMMFIHTYTTEDE